jgi:hypothetical protein
MLEKNPKTNQSSTDATTHQFIFMMNVSKNITNKIGAKAQSSQCFMIQYQLYPFQVNGLKGD